MSLLKSLTVDDSIANEKDTLGGGVVLNSALYEMTILMAFLTKSKGGALGLNLTLKTTDGAEVKQVLYITSGDAKGNKNYYEKDGEKNYLPGYLQADALCLLAAGKPISQIDTEIKVLNVYSAEAKAEVPTKVEVLMDLLNKDILVGMIKQTVDKNEKVNDVYVATGETREENEIDKLFRVSDRMTTAEIRAKATEAVFAAAWEAKWTGKTKNKSKGAAAGGTAGVPGASTGTKKPTTSLFG